MVEVRKPGYVARFVSIERGMSPRIMGNLVPSALGLLYATVADDNLSGGAALLSGGLLTGAGFLVDWITGRTADHDPKRVTVNLELEMPPPSRP
jgi:hypothetical protein